MQRMSLDVPQAGDTAADGQPAPSPRTLRREQLSLHSQMVANGQQDPSIHRKIKFYTLGCCAPFIDRDCFSCHDSKPACCQRVKLHHLKKSIDTVRNCAECVACVGSSVLCCATAGASGCYEYYVAKKNPATVVPVQEASSQATTNHPEITSARRPSPQPRPRGHRRNLETILPENQQQPRSPRRRLPPISAVLPLTNQEENPQTAPVNTAPV